jgi:hypothetical protein
VATGPSIERAGTAERTALQTRPRWDIPRWRVAWLDRLADAVEGALEGAASRLAERVGWPAALLLLLPVTLMLRPMIALARAVQRSRILGALVVMILAVGVAAGPAVGTRAGLFLVPIYALGWMCALKSVSTAETADIAREHLHEAGRQLRRKLVPFHVHSAPDRDRLN